LLRSMPQPMDEARLGASVRQAKDRLQPAASSAAKVPIERADDDIIEVSAELVVDYASSPSALRSLQIELIEEIEEEAVRAVRAASAEKEPPKPPPRKPPPPPPVKKQAPHAAEPETHPAATPLGLGWPYGRAPRPHKKSP